MSLISFRSRCRQTQAGTHGSAVRVVRFGSDQFGMAVVTEFGRFYQTLDTPPDAQKGRAVICTAARLAL